MWELSREGPEEGTGELVCAASNQEHPEWIWLTDCNGMMDCLPGFMMTAVKLKSAAPQMVNYRRGAHKQRQARELKNSISLGSAACTIRPTPWGYLGLGLSTWFCHWFSCLKNISLFPSYLHCFISSNGLCSDCAQPGVLRWVLGCWVYSVWLIPINVFLNKYIQQEMLAPSWELTTRHMKIMNHCYNQSLLLY